MTEPLKTKFAKTTTTRSQSPFPFGRFLLTAVLAVIGSGVLAVWFFRFRMPSDSTRTNQDQTELKLTEPVNRSTDLTANTTTPSAESNMSEEPRSETKPSELKKKAVEEELKSYVSHLAETIGERNLNKYDELCTAADFIEDKFKEFGYTPKRQTYQAKGLDCINLDVEIKGTTKPDEIVIIGGHYDSVRGSPGANDNGSGTAAMLALANHFCDAEPERTLRFVAWTNEEPPYFQNRGLMGSWVYAEKCRMEDQNIVAVLSLETMGYFTDKEKSQKYPAPLNLLYPSTGNFIGFVSDVNSRGLQRQVIKSFRKHANVPSECALCPTLCRASAGRTIGHFGRRVTLG